MKEISLTRGKVALIDDEDFKYLNQWKWYAHKIGRTYYADCTQKINDHFIHVYMHRIIMKPSKGMEIDHIDHNGLNNQKSNLRFCTHSQNMKNHSQHGLKKFVGVSCRALLQKYELKDGTIKYCKNKPRYRARIKNNGIIYFLGSYQTEEEAAIVYNKASKKLNGEFANLNIIK
jgi:hypothetical protein